MKPRIGSLFSGAGGLDLAVERVFAGETIWHSEVDPAASKVLAHRWPGVPNLGDITQIDWDTVEPIDILCGGYPCQPFSAAGQRNGVNDERHLWPYFHRAIRHLRPRHVVLENVAGHRSMGFDSVLADLAGIGFDADWCSVRASDVGAPHRRERLFVVAYPQRGEWSGERFPRRNGAEFTPTGCHSVAVADSSGDGRHEARHEPAGLERGFDAALGGAGPVDLLPTPCAGDGMAGRTYGSNGTQINLKGIVRVLDGDSSGLPVCAELDALLPTPTSRDHKGPNQRQDDSCLHGALLSTPQARDYKGVPGDEFNTACLAMDVVSTQWGAYGPAIARWENLTRAAPSPTEPNTKGNPRLNPAFSEWMLGWPDGWVTDMPGISRNDQLRIVGNGVCPQQAIAALRYLLAVCSDENPGACSEQARDATD